MLDKYKELLDTAKHETEQAQKFLFFCALLRSVTQLASISSLELYSDFAATDEGLDLNGILRRLHHPSDGDSLVILDDLIPRIRSSLWPSFSTGWFETSNTPAIHSEPALAYDLQQWVAFRNNKPAHGVMDKSSTNEWSQRIQHIAERTIAVLADAIPEESQNSEFFLSTPWGKVQLETPVAIKGFPVVFREFRNKRGLWSIDVQPLDWDNSPSARLTVPNGAPTVRFLPEPHGKFHARDVLVDGKSVGVLANVPNRQSSIFEGRRDEQSELVEWLCDYESRACLVYGDGGVGKTTLVLEVLNNLLDDEMELETYPTVISFYSAKLTRWTTSGIVHFKSVSTAVEDAVRELLLVIEDVLSKEWYTVQGRALIDRVATNLHDAGLDRDDIVLVLDNTETMARKFGEEDELVKIISQISRKVARVLLTSRRREKVEARQIELLPMPEADALALLRKLGNEYTAEAIQKAGDARLRKIANNLGRKPLLIDIIARHVGTIGGSLDNAYDSVMQASSEGLSEFLYEDAWLRMTESHRSVFLSLTCLDVPLNAKTVGWVCRELDVPHTEWLNSFYETYFGQVTEYGSDYQMEFESLAEDFFKIKLGDLNDTERERIRGVARHVETLAVRAEKAMREYTHDRVGNAFRTPSARAAKVAGARGNIREAIDWFKEAIKEDPLNSQLFDRYAWFMMVKANDIDEALKLSSRSLELDEENADAHLTKGLALYRKGRMIDGDAHIGHAVRLGKPEIVGLMRRGISRFYASFKAPGPKVQATQLKECIRFLQNASKRLDPADPYSEKNSRDIEKYTAMANAELRRLQKVISGGRASGLPRDNWAS